MGLNAHIYVTLNISESKVNSCFHPYWVNTDYINHDFQISDLKC